MAKPTGDAAPLPEFLTGSAAGVRWGRYRPKRAPHCDVCVWQCHYDACPGPPRRASWKWTGDHRGLLDGRPQDADVFLCSPHATTWRGLDDAARKAAKGKPWLKDQR